MLLPKQLLANYRDVPQNLIEPVVDANCTRKDFVVDQALSRVAELVYSGTVAPVVGVYRLTMKMGSDSFRTSSVFGHHEVHQSKGRSRGGVRPTFDAFWERWRRWALLKSFPLTAASALRFSFFLLCSLLLRVCSRNSRVIHVPQTNLWDMDGRSINLLSRGINHLWPITRP